MSAAPLDPLAGSTHTSQLSRDNTRYPSSNNDGSDDDSAPKPAKQVQRGPREKRYKGGQ